MNKTFIILTIAATVLLLVLLVVLSLFRSKIQSDITSPSVPAPTAFQLKREGETPSSTNQSGFGTNLSPTTLKAMAIAQNKLPISTDSAQIDYSTLTNKIYVQTSSDLSEEDLQKLLEDVGLANLYSTNPGLFVITRSRLAPLITREEQALDFSPDDQEDESTKPLTYGEQRKQNQTTSFNTLVKNLLSFQVPGEETKDILTIPVSFGSATSPINTPTITQSAPITFGKDTSNVPCAAGTDYGVADGYSNGALTKIRVCRVAGMVVNSQVSKQVNDMKNAWTAAGIPLAGGSFRTMDGQIAIYQSWCKRDGIVGSPPPYPKAPGKSVRCPGGAAPGYSNHQMGFAIDFTCAGSLIPRKYSAASQNKCFQWLAANAGKYGFFEYGYGKTRDGSTGYEGWHWSVNGN